MGIVLRHGDGSDVYLKPEHVIGFITAPANTDRPRCGLYLSSGQLVEIDWDVHGHGEGLNQLLLATGLGRP